MKNETVPEVKVHQEEYSDPPRVNICAYFLVILGGNEND